MSEETLRWLLGGFCSLVMIYITASVPAYINLLLRIVSIETTMKILGINTAKAMHSPHTPELDAIIDELARDKTLSREQWKRLREICDEILHDVNAAKQERSLAGTLIALHHKEMEVK